MSFSRLALRLSTIEALRPTSAVTTKGPFPTIAGMQVLDSSITPIEDFRENQAQSIIGVYTEHDDGQAGQKRGGPPFLLTIDLVFEVSMVVKIAKDGDPGQFDVMMPETDAELEASLDLVEAQIKVVLLYGPSGEIWRSVSHRRIHNPRSVPHRTSEEGVRLAKRTMTWKIEVNDDHYDPAPAATPTGLAILPEPLRRLAEQMPKLSYALKILNGIAAEPTAPVMPIAVPLETVTLSVSVANPTTGALPVAPQIAAEVDDLED